MLTHLPSESGHVVTSSAGRWLFDALDRLRQALAGKSGIEAVACAALDELLAIFDGDRAVIVRQDEQLAGSWRLVADRQRLGTTSGLPLTEAMLLAAAASFDAVLACTDPIVPDGLADQFRDGSLAAFGGRSQIVSRVVPATGAPYVLVLTRPSPTAPWSADERWLFREVARQLAAALSTSQALFKWQQSERRLAEAQRTAGIGYWERDLPGSRMMLSDEACRILGITQDDVKGASADSATWSEWIHPDDRARVVEAVDAALRGESRLDVEFRVARPDGEIRYVHSDADLVPNEVGPPSRWFGTIQDVTDLKRAEQELRTSEARFRAFIDYATDGLFIIDDNVTVVDANREACESLGYTRDELIGLHPAAFDPSATPAVVEERGRHIFAGELVSFETHHRRKDGTLFPVEMRLRRFVTGGRGLAIGLARDITERRLAEQALGASHQLLRSIVEATADAIFLKDLQGRYLLINSAGARFLGRDVGEIIGRTDDELFSADTAEVVLAGDRQVMATGETQVFEETATAAGVTRTYMAQKSAYRDARGQIIGVVGVSRDITELKRLEDQFRQSQKMDAVGRLAGGMAHDFNNLLTAINGCSEIVLGQLGQDDARRGLVGEILKAGTRAATLTRQLLAFSRKQILQPEVLSLNVVLNELMQLLRRLLREDIDLSLVLNADDMSARVDRGQFEQAIVNLAVNARDAMPEGGRIVVETSTVTLADEDPNRHPELQPGRYVVVAVSDTGHGMDEGTRSRVFEPFFTTKGPGGGTGLGLAMVYGFVKQSDGHVDVRSQPGAGTTFRVLLPYVHDPAPVDQPVASPFSLPAGSETVLLVEDEDAVRTFARFVLETSGYTVLDARDGRDALDLVRGHSGPIHLVVIDLVMPAMGGQLLADRLREVRGSIKVLFMSGHTEEVALRQGVEAASVAFLQKPFAPADLARKVRQVLDGGTVRK